MNKNLPSRPNLEHLRHQAKALLASAHKGDPDSELRFRRTHPRLRFTDQNGPKARPTLADAQLVIAREYGFASWPKLKRHVEQLDAVEGRVADLRSSFATASEDGRRELLKPLHTAERFKHYQPGFSTLSDNDARLLIANAEGYAFWSKYESYLNLDPDVQEVILAVRGGDLENLRKVLAADLRATFRISFDCPAAERARSIP